MKKQENIDQAIENALNLAENISQVPPSPFLKAKILATIAQEGKPVRQLMFPKVALGMAAAIVFLALNVVSILQYQKAKTATQSANPYAEVGSQYQVRSGETDLHYYP